MKTAIVTGASSGIGLEITRTLLSMDYKVYGLSRKEIPLAESEGRLIHVRSDLLETKKLRAAVSGILNAEPTLDLLVNCAGTGLFGPHEQLDSEALSQMLRLNLEVPVLLCQLTLRALKASKGRIINISSITAEKHSTHACAYAASKAGLSHFSKSLFEEVRKYGVGVTVLQPDMTRTPFYDKLDFEPGIDADAAILPEQVADAVRYILESSCNFVVSEVSLRPQLGRILRKQPSEKDGHTGSGSPK